MRKLVLLSLIATAGLSLAWWDSGVEVERVELSSRAFKPASLPPVVEQRKVVFPPSAAPELDPEDRADPVAVAQRTEEERQVRELREPQVSLIIEPTILR
jgi:hypothetical protein